MSERYDGIRAVVVGLGASGEAAARALSRRGAHVIVVDRADDARIRERMSLLSDVDVRLGVDGAREAATADLVVVSPGVAPWVPAVTAAREAGVTVTTEVDIAYELSPHPERLIGITGTNGKTTSTEMTVAALTGAGVDAVPAGNIGRPLVDVIEESHDVIVVELSSFQLEYARTLRCHIGVLLNIAEDHLDWHGSFEAYASAKTKLFAPQEHDDVAIHFDDVACARAASAGQGRRVPFSNAYKPAGGAGIEDGWIAVPEGRVVAVDELRVGGAAMIADATAAAAAAAAYGADLSLVAKGLASFEAAPHRLERVATVAGVTFVNDSKATNPHATLSALSGMSDVVLIAGGRNKGMDLSVLSRAAQTVKAVVAIGESTQEVLAAFPGVPGVAAETIDDAVRRAARLAKPGDTVLLSPACASFDLFADYRARGDAFHAAVTRLAGEEGAR